jgi:hypothetical protein
MTMNEQAIYIAHVKREKSSVILNHPYHSSPHYHHDLNMQKRQFLHFETEENENLIFTFFITKKKEK